MMLRYYCCEWAAQGAVCTCEWLCECERAELGVDHDCTALPTCDGDAMMPLDDLLTLDEVP